MSKLRYHNLDGDAVLASITDRAKRQLSAEQYALVEPFLAQYFQQLDSDDFAEREPADLYGAALAHWQFLRRFVSGAPKLRVYNPTLEEHGWQSNHTVAEMVNDDMPFLVDSVTMEINRQGLALHLIIHPVVRVMRDQQGNLVELLPVDEKRDGTQLESYIHVEMDRQTDPARLKEIHDGLMHVLGDVRLAVEDWKAMLDKLRHIVAGISDAKQAMAAGAEEVAEESAFLQWIGADHFTFLGYREYELANQGGQYGLRPVESSGLGLLRKPPEQTDAMPFTAIPREAAQFIEGPHLLLFTKANMRSTVHRPGYLDYIGIKRFDSAGRVNGELRFLGLLTSAAYSTSVTAIPLIRRKLRTVTGRAGFLPGSHMDKSLVAILENYPRDELFQIDDDNLYGTALGILRLQERQRTRLFVRRDPFGRFFSCMVFVPRERYNTELRLKVQQILMQAFNGSSAEFSPELSESVLARIHFTIRTEAGSTPEYDVRELEARIVAASRRWQDDLRDALIERLGEGAGTRLFHRFGEAFPAGFREDYAPRTAVHDIEMMDRLDPQGGLGMNLYVPIEDGPGHLRLKLYNARRPVTLSESLPMLEHMGVKVMEERPYRIETEDGQLLWVHDLGLELGDDGDLEVERIKPLFQEVFAKAAHGEIENDDFNRLVIKAQLGSREITILRAYAKYFRQIGFNFSQPYIEATVAKNAALARKLVQLFLARFDPSMQGAQDHAAALLSEIDQALDQVANLDEDRILRQYVAAIQATTRTNYFQRAADGAPKSYLSFKFDPAKVPGLPEPKPVYEIWVYSRRMEGLHIRGGRVARGGLRWSDRREDFRTEVLGLAKAQMVKNTVIVPVGSKGGFVVRNPPPAADREAFQAEGIACYKTLLRGMLDLTDNLVQEKVVPPKDVVRRDGDDTYLVVAADKGTATFSDIANGISAEYGYWLGDAFASGGSVGYDHKKMGITARGAWESVKRHFRELALDIQTTDFTVVGIGDMSGDVFGNGMLRSRHIHLVAAFDHRDIFLDPHPNPEASFTERERLFNLPRSSWQDYDKTLISQGGGIYPRSLKTIPLSPEIRARLGVDAEHLTPPELVHAIVGAPVDLLYNGGIGTYVKASTETHAQVGDRANDAIRVDGRDLRCKVVVEGGNLGFTQLGRVEFALAGGRINTDAIDNSAGVDCSDHEVNIKILLDSVVAAGDMTEKQRNQLLVEMTDEVAMLVLQDNYYQTQALSVAGRLAPHLIDSHARLIHALEDRKLLNRKIEFLPSDEQIAQRKAAGLALTTPERAVLLAYSKMALYEDLLASNLPEDTFFAQTLVEYFPHPLREKYLSAMHKHPLRREIIATYVTNGTVNRAGSTFVQRIVEETGAKPSEVVRAYTSMREVFALPALWRDIEALDNVVTDEAQARMLLDIGRLIGRATLWFISRRPGEPIGSTVEAYASGVANLVSIVDTVLAPTEAEAFKARQNALVESGVSIELARKLASYATLFSALDVIDIAKDTGREVAAVAAVYFALEARLRANWLEDQIRVLADENHWVTLAKAALEEDLDGLIRALTTAVLRLSPRLDAAEALIDAWTVKNAAAIERVEKTIDELKGAAVVDLSMLSVAMRELRALGQPPAANQEKEAVFPTL